MAEWSEARRGHQDWSGLSGIGWNLVLEDRQILDEDFGWDHGCKNGGSELGEGNQENGEKETDQIRPD